MDFPLHVTLNNNKSTSYYIVSHEQEYNTSLTQWALSENKNEQAHLSK